MSRSIESSKTRIALVVAGVLTSVGCNLATGPGSESNRSDAAGKSSATLEYTPSPTPTEFILPTATLFLSETPTATSTPSEMPTATQTPEIERTRWHLENQANYANTLAANVGVTATEFARLLETSSATMQAPLETEATLTPTATMTATRVLRDQRVVQRRELPVNECASDEAIDSPRDIQLVASCVNGINSADSLLPVEDRLSANGTSKINDPLNGDPAQLGRGGIRSDYNNEYGQGVDPEQFDRPSTDVFSILDGGDESVLVQNGDGYWTGNVLHPAHDVNAAALVTAAALEAVRDSAISRMDGKISSEEVLYFLRSPDQKSDVLDEADRIMGQIMNYELPISPEEVARRSDAASFDADRLIGEIDPSLTRGTDGSDVCFVDLSTQGETARTEQDQILIHGQLRQDGQNKRVDRDVADRVMEMQTSAFLQGNRLYRDTDRFDLGGTFDQGIDPATLTREQWMQSATGDETLPCDVNTPASISQPGIEMTLPGQPGVVITATPEAPRKTPNGPDETPNSSETPGSPTVTPVLPNSPDSAPTATPGVPTGNETLVPTPRSTDVPKTDNPEGRGDNENGNSVEIVTEGGEVVGETGQQGGSGEDDDDGDDNNDGGGEGDGGGDDDDNSGYEGDVEEAFTD